MAPPIGGGQRGPRGRDSAAVGAIVELLPELPDERTGGCSVCLSDEPMLLGSPTGATTAHRLADGARLAALHGLDDEVLALTWADGALWSGSEDGTIIRRGPAERTIAAS